MNFEKYIEEYYENFAKNAKGQIEGTVEDFVTLEIQDFLVQKGYGRDNAEAIVDFLTTNNQEIDYSNIPPITN